MANWRLVMINRTILKKSQYYPHFLAKYMRTKQGQAFALSIISQLIDGFEVDAAGDKIISVHINDQESIKIDLAPSS